jgi:hypothetical protein
MQKQARLEGVGQLNKSVRNYLRSAIRREVLKPTSMVGVSYAARESVTKGPAQNRLLQAAFLLEVG